MQGNEQNLKRKPEETQQIQKAKAAKKEVDGIISTMVGLDGVKLQLEKWIKGLVLDQQRKNLGLELGTRKALHMAFLGNPGTGKTMVARYLGKVLHKLGLTSTDKVVEVQRTDLVGEYVGQTGIKTRMKIKEARGGILFVDEAYKLVPHDIYEFGVEALEEIMTAMDDKDIVVIFAGYSKEMERVIAANHGFARRVTNFFYFEDYSSTDIALILQSKFVNQKNGSYIFGFKLHPDCTVDAVAKLIKEHTTEEQMRKMNGGLVDPLLVKALDNLNFRLNEDCSDLDALMTITMEDLEEGLKSLSSNEKEIVLPAMYI
ncbi:uncharacterized protein A4U43_C05F8540 [Asparagus officinalis]|uniref:AAA+ ATPase domain-containing protein n=2 Tax=Asparagus officinalis TaxID=4686 RepID=A0A5P1EQH4_ASPOF|nr:uncharacterized protein A4U43_C05F8540 [Asparagus officinalis]